MIYNIFFLLCALITISYGSNAPVLIWGTNSALKPVLSVVSSQELAEEIRPHLSDSLLLVFVEKKLSTQDLSQCKSDLGTSCYENLTKFTPHTYYSSVENPLVALKSLGGQQEEVEVSPNGVSDKDIPYKAGTVVYVYFEEDDTQREEELRNHDRIISQLFQELSHEGKVIALYTSLKSRNKRQAREAASNPETNSSVPVWFLVGEKFLMYYTGLQYVVGNDVTTIHITKQDLKESKPNVYDVELIDDKNEKLSFQIEFDKGYWSMKNLKYKSNTFRINPAITVPLHFSYYCGEATRYAGIGTNEQLIIKGLQMQPFTAKVEKSVFGDPWHCIGFTSPGIWGGLFVTFLLLGILTIGVLWLMDVKTMDRFDDPKGKTITINATD